LGFALVFLVSLCGVQSIGQAQSSPNVVVWGTSYTNLMNVPPSLTNAIAIAAGPYHCLALKSDGKVIAWGGNYYYAETNVPANLSNVVAIAAGEAHSVALKSDGTVVAWGSNPYAGVTNVPAGLSNVVAIAAGDYHSLALDSDGTVVAWGQDSVPAGLSNVVAVACGSYHSLALKADSTVIAWGGNEFGQTNVPSGLSNVIAIAGGYAHSMALKADGTVVAWMGSAAWNYGQTNVPAGLSNVIAIACGSTHSLALKADYTVVGWGYSHDGETNVPAGLRGVAAIAAGNDSMALTGRLVIQSQPSSQTTSTNTNVSFQVQVIGASPITYQWFFNLTNLIADGTNAVLQMTNVQFSDSGAYTAVVSNRFGSATSAPALLTVTAPPVITAQPTNQEVFPGETANFLVVAVGAAPLAYQWFFGSGAILQGTNATLQMTNVEDSQAGAYAVVITNVYGAVTSAPARLDVFSPIVRAARETALRAALELTNRVTFACDGTIVLNDNILIGTNIVLDGSGHQVTISGSNAVRVFVVPADATLTLTHLTIADGATVGRGAGILNQGGTVNATDCRFVGNKASNVNEFLGGAIYNGGMMSLDLCIFTNNGAIGRNLNYSLFFSGSGGAIFNEGMLVVRRSAFTGNYASGGDPGGNGNGGAIYNEGTLWLENSTLANNGAEGATGSKGLDGGSYDGNPAGWPGGPGGQGAGSALFNAGNATAVNTTFAGNTAQGGPGGNGGNGGTFSAYGGDGGHGGNGGDAWGAIYDANGALHLVNCTLANNSGYGGMGGMGGQGGPAPPGGPPGHYGGFGSNGSGSGGMKSSGSLLINTVLAANASNCSGSITDGGHNLSSDGSCAFTAIGSMNDTDPKLGPLADNGGPTLTMALLPGSPAIDAGSAVGAPATDQRGVPRPQDAGVDIGAFEYLVSPVFTGMTVQSATNCQMQLCGLTPNPALTLQVSTNLLNWRDVTNFMAGPNGVFQCVDPVPGDAQARFYRLKSGTP
jgi:hypothetical protein